MFNRTKDISVSLSDLSWYHVSDCTVFVHVFFINIHLE